MAKVLVVGGAGYIGSHVVKELMKSGHEVTVFDNLSTGQEINLFQENRFIRGDIRNQEEIAAAMRGQDAVVHLAAKKAVGESMENPMKYSDNNINGSLNILNAMVEAGTKYIVFSSSAAVYGMPEKEEVDEDCPIAPINYYGFTKAEIEKFMGWYDRLKGLKYVALRYFNAVGYDADGDIRGREVNPQNLLPIIMEVAEGKRDKLKIFGSDYPTRDGTCIRDYIHVSDLATAHVLAIEKLMSGMPSQALNLGTGSGTSVKEMLTAAEQALGKKIPAEYAPRRPGDPAVLIASAAKAREFLGWEAKYGKDERGMISIIRTML